MPDRPDKTIRRRELLRSLVRYPLLGLLGLAGGYLATRRGEPLQSDETCSDRGLCRGCRHLAGCGLPQATMTRRVLEDGRRF